MFLTTKSNIRTIRPGDPDWIITDGLMISHRAGFEISQRCPDNYVSLLQECINQGWIKPIAYQPVHEEFMEKLTK
jgi:hypothetical protein